MLCRVVMHHPEVQPLKIPRSIHFQSMQMEFWSGGSHFGLVWSQYIPSTQSIKLAWYLSAISNQTFLSFKHTTNIVATIFTSFAQVLWTEWLPGLQLSWEFKRSVSVYEAPESWEWFMWMNEMKWKLLTLKGTESDPILYLSTSVKHNSGMFLFCTSEIAFLLKMRQHKVRIQLDQE